MQLPVAKKAEGEEGSSVLKEAGFIKIFFVLFTLAIFLTGPRASLLQAQPAPVEQTSAKDTDKTEEVEALVKPLTRNVYQYEPAGRRDPFLSLLEVAKKKMKERVRRSLSPLENYDLSEVKLLGVVYDGKEYYASIVLPDSRSFTIKKGHGLGMFGGRVSEIFLDRVVVKEQAIDHRGKAFTKRRVLTLRQEDEE